MSVQRHVNKILISVFFSEVLDESSPVQLECLVKQGRVFITSSTLACMFLEVLHSLNKPCVITSKWYKGGIRRFKLWYWCIVYKRCTVHFFQYWLDSPEFGYRLMLIMIPQFFFSWILLLLSSLLFIFVDCIVCKYCIWTVACFLNPTDDEDKWQ